MTDHVDDEPGASSTSDLVHEPWLNFSITPGEAGCEDDDHDHIDAPAEPDASNASTPSGPHASWSADDRESTLSRKLSVKWPSAVLSRSSGVSAIAGKLFKHRRDRETSVFSGYDPKLASLGNSLAGPAPFELTAVSCSDRSADQSRCLRLPEVGDVLFGFQLRFPLGRGAFARVFLAEQSDLAGRPVVLKVSAIEGTEPQTLAQLQHTNIVPIYSAHEDPRAGLRAVCMPYFGGASLSSVLQYVWSDQGPPHSGAQFVAALESVQSPPPSRFRHGVEIDLAASVEAPSDQADAATGPPPASESTAEAVSLLAQLRKRSYIQATAWIVSQIADGLQHAHQRGIFHRDIKPSNVLISAEGQPLLLDFNLAQDQDIDPELATLGGTVAYMAPEHLRALAGRSAALIRQVDHRSDIYSLGMVLAEMLTGQSPFDQSASYSAVPLQIEAMAVERGGSCPSVRQQRSDIPWGLESVVRKCLAPDPAERYQQAEHLAEDLRRFLDDRPLRYAPELSRLEQVQKFARRHPRLTSTGTVAAAALVLLIAAGSALYGIRERLGAAQARDRFRAHEQGTTQALCLVNTVLDHEDHLRQGVSLCEKTLALYQMAPGSPGRDHPDHAYLSTSQRLKLLEDRRELLMLLADGGIRLCPNDREVRRRALKLLDEAQAIKGLAPSRALRVQRADALERLAETRLAAEERRLAERTPATTARDHYLLATTYAREGDSANLRRAMQELDEALRINPRHYWSTVQRGICHAELGEHLLAAADFGQSIGLWPEFAWGYFNRGWVLDRVGRKSEAILDYTAALERDPGFVPAAINRGITLIELKRYSEALADFDRAISLGHRDALVDAGRGIALEGLKRHAEADRAFAAAFARVAPRPDPARARLCWSYGFAVWERLPEKARAAFDDVLLQDPNHPQALYGRAMLAAAAGRSDDAIAAMSRALESNPGFNEARRSRAVLLARKGDWDRAGQDINWCLEREPGSADTLYAAACVAALAAGASPSPRATHQAFELLQKALDAGIVPARAAADPDLAPIRKDPRFPALVNRRAKSEVCDRRSPSMR